MGWRVNRFWAEWLDGYTAAAADMKISAIISDKLEVTTAASIREVSRLSWAVSNTAGVAVTYPIQPIQEVFPFDNTIVRPYLYLGVDSAGTGLANDIVFIVEYEEVKLTDNQVLTLLTAGCS